jgi:lipase chaperone LimK
MRRLLLAALVVVLGAAAFVWRDPGTPVEYREGAAASARVERASEAMDDEDAPFIPGGGADHPGVARPRSLRGTRVDGGLLIDENGRFVPTLDARRLFDYILTGSGEVPADALRARIIHEIERRVPTRAVADATALLDRYLAYRERVRALASAEGNDATDLDARLATLVALRREMLGTEAAEAFFAEEEADARRLLEVRRVMRDPALSPEARAERVAAIAAAVEAELPPKEREAHAATRLATTLRTAEEELKSRGGDAGEVQQLRERLAGPEAATRLADLDRQRAVWQSRVTAYRAARERLANDPALDEGRRATAIARLLEESFTEPERRRVAALDRLSAENPPP